MAEDFDADGDIDLGYVGLSGAVGWLESDGGSTPTFTDHLLGSSFGKGTSISAGDIDGDGDQDMLVAMSANPMVPRPYDDSFVIFENDGSGGFSDELFDSGQDPTSIVAQDLDGDGDLEVCLLYTSPSPRDLSTSRMPSSA